MAHAHVGLLATGLLSMAASVVVPGEGNLVVNRHGACALKTDRSLECWGRVDTFDHEGSRETVISMTNGLVLRAIYGGYNNVCWVASNGETGCGGEQYRGPNAMDVPSGVIGGKVAPTWSSAIAIDSQGKFQAWGYWKHKLESDIAISGTPAVDVDCGNDFCCAILSDGSIKCEYYTPIIAPRGNFSRVWCRHDRYDDMAPLCCALPVGSGDLECFAGEGTHVQPGPPPGVRFDSLSIALAFICGIRSSDSLVHCWGADWQSVPRPRLSWALDHSILAGKPTEPATEVSCFKNKCCAIMAADGSVVCWGSSAPLPPPGLVVVRAVTSPSGTDTTTLTETTATSTSSVTRRRPRRRRR